jgi:hypothetical protein
VASLLHGDLPILPTYAVCTECKMRENICLLKEKDQPVDPSWPAVRPLPQPTPMRLSGTAEEANVAPRTCSGGIYGPGYPERLQPSPAEAIKPLR